MNFYKNDFVFSDFIVYLKTDPEVVYERICARGRTEEDSISLSYLKSIHKLHEDWLFHKKFGAVPPVSSLSHLNLIYDVLANSYSYYKFYRFIRYI